MAVIKGYIKGYDNEHSSYEGMFVSNITPAKSKDKLFESFNIELSLA